MGLGDKYAMTAGIQIKLRINPYRHATSTEVGDFHRNYRQHPALPLQPALHGLLHWPTLTLAEVGEPSERPVSQAKSGHRSHKTLTTQAREDRSRQARLTSS